MLMNILCGIGIFFAMMLSKSLYKVYIGEPFEKLLKATVA